MPEYTYFCEPCKAQATVEHRMTEDPEIICPKCRKPMKRLIEGGQHFILKGPGFHCNDYSDRVMKGRDAQAANKKVK